MGKSRQLIIVTTVIVGCICNTAFSQRVINPPMRTVPAIRQQNPAVIQTYEAEAAKPIVSGGRVITQDMRQFGNWSGGNQLLWVDNRPNQRLELQFSSSKAGRFPVSVFMTKAADFADLSIGYNGRQISTFSGFSANVTRASVDLGQLDLQAGNNTLIFNVTGKDRRSTGFRVGIDNVQVDFGIANVRPSNPDVLRVPTTPWVPDRQVPDSHQPIPGPTGDPGWSGGGAGNPLPDFPVEIGDPIDHSDLNVKLAEGADLYVRMGDIILRDTQQLGTGRSTLSLTYDVSKVPGAGAVIIQVAQTGFRTEQEGNGYPEMKPYSLAQTGNLPGSYGHVRIDFAQIKKTNLQPYDRPDFHVRVIPVASVDNPGVVGKASNIIDVYYNKALPPPSFKFAKVLQVQAFADTIEAKLAEKTTGYALTILPPGQSPVYRSGGMARTETDGSPRPMTVHDRINIASVTKFAVAIAIVKAIDQNPNITLDSKILPYLPGTWTKGPNVDTITFRELLGHRSGFRGEANDIDDENLETMIATGIPDIATKSEYKYVNQNFALMRLLMPKIKFISGAGGNGAKLLREVYLSVLSPAGIDWVSAEPDAGTALAYPFPAASTKGQDGGGKLENFGSSGLHMSAAEIAQLMDRFANSEDILSDDLRTDMISGLLGFRTRADSGGICYGKGGYLRWYYSKEEDTSAEKRAEINALGFVFSDGTSIGLVVNSSHADAPQSGPGLTNIVLESFNANCRAFQQKP